MTTLANPLDPPTIICNRSGTAIVEVSASNSSVVGIPRVSGWTVPLITTTSNNAEARVRADAEIGDLVEVHKMNTNPTRLTIRAPAGESFAEPISGEVAAGRLFRKISSTVWVVTGPSEGHP
jgi:hypothetical protein